MYVWLVCSWSDFWSAFYVTQFVPDKPQNTQWSSVEHNGERLMAELCCQWHCHSDLAEWSTRETQPHDCKQTDSIHSATHDWPHYTKYYRSKLMYTVEYQTHVVLCLCYFKFSHRIISPPENDSFWKDFCFTHDVFSFRARSPRCVGRPAWNFAWWSELGWIL